MINNTTTNKEFVSLSSGFDKVKAQLCNTLLSAPSVVRSLTQHLSATSGKMIRAKSLLACSMNDQGQIPKDAIRLALAIELLHLATLVHDDVIDDAKMRRGSMTLQKKFGKQPAVICGDYLFCLSLQLAAETAIDRDRVEMPLTNYMIRICLGELMQNLNHKNYNLTTRRYLKIISGKTAALFEAAFYAGAVLCDEPKNEIGKYSRLGRYVGMIFQLSDDCIDYEASQDKAKKTVLSDFEQGVITLPLIYAFKSEPQLKSKAKSGKVTKDEIRLAVLKHGGLEYTKSVSKKYYKKAIEIIDRLNANSYKKETLKSILDRAYNGLR